MAYKSWHSPHNTDSLPKQKRRHVGPKGNVIPESHNQDSVGCLARTVRDATYCLDGIYGQDPRDNYTLAQNAPADGFAQYLATKKALKGAVFGLPWLSFWQYASANQQQQLLEVVNLIKSAGATIINGTELPNYATIVSPPLLFRGYE
ncbi:hypothetical protein V501_05445 [Pseudogymnoascus sp. VKM F-4519 (FW-2642)]|nr:hypothetical protein V501_05445 [Pseudogymnoascus sp. VKM F-4519 (FW-2642)]